VGNPLLKQRIGCGSGQGGGRGKRPGGPRARGRKLLEENRVKALKVGDASNWKITVAAGKMDSKAGRKELTGGRSR